jgi:hypothetical protein
VTGAARTSRVVDATGLARPRRYRAGINESGSGLWLAAGLLTPLTATLIVAIMTPP